MISSLSVPLNVSFQGFYNVHHPDNASNWTVRLQVQLLYPKND